MVELHYFGGLTEAQIAEVLGISMPPLKRIDSQLGLCRQAAELQKPALDSVTVSGDTSLRRVIAELDDGATLSGNGDFAAAKVSIDAAQMHLPALSQVPAEIRIRALAGEGKTNLS